MVENGINQGVVYEGYTATAQYDTSSTPASTAGNEKQPVPVKESPDELCDPPIVVEHKAKK